MGLAQEIINLLEESRPIIIDYKDGDTIILLTKNSLGEGYFNMVNDRLGKISGKQILLLNDIDIDKVIHISDANEKEDNQGIPLVGGKKYTQDNIQEAIDKREGGI